MSNSFKVGDIVTAAPGDMEYIERRVGVAKNGLYIVDKVNTFSVVIRPKVPMATNPAAGAVIPIDMSRLVLRPEGANTVRLEGEEIRPEHILVGDHIRVSKVSGNLTMIHEGIVGSIEEQRDHKFAGTKIFKTTVTRLDPAQRINWSKDADETFTLLKPVPPRDLLLDRLTGALAGQVITYRESWARKHNDEKWDIVFASKVVVVSTTYLRETIGESDVVWLQAGS